MQTIKLQSTPEILKGRKASLLRRTSRLLSSTLSEVAGGQAGTLVVRLDLLSHIGFFPFVLGFSELTSALQAHQVSHRFTVFPQAAFVLQDQDRQILQSGGG